VVSADTDFGTILAATKASKPSVVLFRLDHDRRVEDLVALLEANRDTLAPAIGEGSIVVISDSLVRIRTLPIL
jgi:predicted nuclease of predicted toxin-antitoxin system